MCHLGSFRILLVGLAVLTVRVEGFAISRSTHVGADKSTAKQIETRATKIWPLDAVKLNKLDNEMQSKEASLSTTSIFLSTGAPNETQTPAAYEPTTQHPAATTASTAPEATATTASEATAATTEDTQLKSTYESQSEISGVYSNSSFTNTTSTQNDTTTPPSDIIYTNHFDLVENGSISTAIFSTNASVTLDVTSTEKNIFRNIFSEVKNITNNISEVKNENASKTIGPVKSMSVSETENENASTTIGPVKNMSISSSEIENENASTTIGPVKNMSDSTSETENASTTIGPVKNMSVSTSEIENENTSTSIAQDQNVSLSTESLSANSTAAKKAPLSAILEKFYRNATLWDESSSAINYENVSTTTTQINNESVKYNDSKNVSVNSSQSDLLASDRKIYADALNKNNLFIDYSRFMAEAASSNEPVTIADHFYETKSSIASTSIINLDAINISTTDVDNSNFTDITKNNPKTTIVDEKITPADKIVLTTKSAITSSKASEKTNQDLMTPEADNTSYSSKSVEINDITTTDTSSGTSSAISTLEIREPTTTEISVTENTPYAYLGSGHNEDIGTSFHTKFRNEITENTPSSFNWKKYSLIDWIRTTTEAVETTTENFEILYKAGTKDVKNTFRGDQTYLKILENKLLSLDKMTTMESSTTSFLTYSNFTTELPLEFTEKTTTFPQSQPTKPNVVSSLRAGFLDFSSRTTTIASEISSNKGIAPVTSRSTVYSSKNTSTHETTHIPEAKPTTMKTEPERANIRKSSLTTKSLDLVDDAMEEELMKEEIMFNSRELSWKPTKGENLKTTSEPADSNIAGVELTAGPISSEIPLSSERPKLAGLYTVNANYKRLKKIEVQAPRPFVRDPDDNSWRNESLSSRGIVFKANNSTKPFTQVLKNKTESVWNTLLENYNKEQPAAALRERLEKVAEMRKSKKKKFNHFGESVYTDYEESSEGPKSIEIFTMPTLTRGSSLVQETIRDIARYTTVPTVSIQKQTTTSSETNTGKTASSRQFEYEEDEEEDYTLPNIDLKKFMSVSAGRDKPRTPLLSTPAPAPAPTPPAAARPSFPERKPTLQYFPPRERERPTPTPTPTPAPVVMNDYDVDFRNVVNQYTLSIPGKQAYGDLSTPAPRAPPARPDPRAGPFAGQHSLQGTGPSPRGSSLPPPPPPPLIISTPQNTYNIDTFSETTSLPSDHGAYVIKHFRDFVNELINAGGPAADATQEPPPEYTTAAAGVGVEVGAGARLDDHDHGDSSDYEDQFRRHVLSRFMENFNQNSERFKSEFPLLYNTSVVHAGGGGGGEPEAASMAFMRRLYDDARAIQLAGRGGAGAGAVGGAGRPGPPCDRTVELSPDYELHYYVPDGEEREEFQRASVARATAAGAERDPYRRRL